MPPELRAWITQQQYTNSVSGTAIVGEASRFPSRPESSMAGGTEQASHRGSRCAGVLAAPRRSLGETSRCAEQANAFAETICPTRHGAATKDLHIPIRKGEPTP
jgi:hypothetical protein